ncbi:MAG TPA: ATP-binding protein [Xanthobacteraceae bacterium]|jgi:signal transduction histidine kinase
MFENAVQTPIRSAPGLTRGAAASRRQAVEVGRETYGRQDLRRASGVTEVNAFIAHEIKQPLAAIAMSATAGAQWLTRRVPDVAEAVAAFDRIAADVERAGAMIERIYALAGNAKPQMSPLDINAVIDQVIELAGNQSLNRPVSLRFERAAGLPPVHGDVVQLQRVVLNLVVNGVQAMEAVAAPELLIRTRRDGNRMVRVTVQDAGAGTDCEDLKRLFSPFFSTKSSGMGMGLAMSHLIVEAHDGRIWAARNDGPGMTFGFTVPVSHP